MSNAHWKNQVSFLLVSCALIILLSLTSYNVSSYLYNNRVLGASTEGLNENLIDEKNYWESFLAKNPNYIPGWQQLSEMNEALGNNSEALKNLARVKQIDPNYQN